MYSAFLLFLSIAFDAILLSSAVAGLIFAFRIIRILERVQLDDLDGRAMLRSAASLRRRDQ